MNSSGAATSDYSVSSLGRASLSLPLGYRRGSAGGGGLGRRRCGVADGCDSAHEAHGPLTRRARWAQPQGFERCLDQPLEVVEVGASASGEREAGAEGRQHSCLPPPTPRDVPGQTGGDFGIARRREPRPSALLDRPKSHISPPERVPCALGALVGLMKRTRGSSAAGETEPELIAVRPRPSRLARLGKVNVRERQKYAVGGDRVQPGAMRRADFCWGRSEPCRRD
jgi:hypothetical protein